MATSLQVFEFTSSRGVRLDLTGGKVLESWSDDVKGGIVEHQVLGKQGAVHQQPAIPPKKFTAQIVLLGKNVSARWQLICDVLQGDAFGRLVHPRWGAMDAVLESAQGSTSSGDEGDVVNATLVFLQTGTKDPPKPSPVAVATAGALQVAQMQLRAASETPQARQGAASLATAYSAFQSAISSATLSPGSIQTSLGSIRVAVEQIRTGSPSFGFRIQSVVVMASALAAYGRALQGRPPIITYPVAADCSLSSLCVQLYGGARASTMRAEIMRLNRLADTLNIPAKTSLLLSDPVSIRRLPVAPPS